MDDCASPRMASSSSTGSTATALGRRCSVAGPVVMERGAIDGDALSCMHLVHGPFSLPATGWRIVTSIDGVHWTDRGLITNLPAPPPSCNIIEGLAFKVATFYAACSETLFRSDDGLHWTAVGPIGKTGG